MKKSVWLALLIILVVVVASVGTNLYLDYLWFIDVDAEEVFWVRYLSEWGLRIVTLVFFFLFLWINLLFTRDFVLKIPNMNLAIREQLFEKGYLRFLTKRWLSFFYMIAAAFLAFILTSYTGAYWMDIHYFLNSIPFGVSDPIFNREAAFYVFQLPFLRLVYSFLMMTVVMTLIPVGIIYVLLNPPGQAPTGRSWLLFPFSGLGHISFLASLILLLKVWDYRVQMWELVISPGGYNFGAGFTDVNVTAIALWVLLFLAAFLAILFFANIFIKQTKILVYGFISLFAISFLGLTVLPGAVQSLFVQPAEFTYERPYLEHNISFTRTAYGIDEFNTRLYSGQTKLTWEDVENSPGTFNNVRLWDYRPIRNTLNELQAIRPYYRFDDVDIDRYMIDGEYRQVMIAARELDVRRLDERAQTWVNQRLQYTHGYGVTMSPVNEVTSEGLPRYFVRDVPPVTSPGVELEQPGIYYGELTTDYVITNTRMPEFDYPMGDENIQTIYDGEGGVFLGGIGRRLLFALRFADYRILLSGELTSESRVKYYRSIKERLNKIAPFLEYDADPYIVVNEGRLFWIQDAYTVSSRYPYSQPQGGINYIRNSVKIIIDAYNGDVAFYIMEPDEPVVQVYNKTFPNLFKPFEEMPEGLRSHLRYPEGLFLTQAMVYNHYHVTDPNVFYNREDLWEFPVERYGGQDQPVEPYYVILQLPGEEEAEFVLIQPFTPIRRNNMIAWMAARCDGENYGEMIVYLFPKDQVIYGPMQIENRIDQNTEISEQLTLWDQSGSRVLRGNLLVLPVNDSVIYVEPIFLEAEGGGLPELARVIVAFDERVIMERTLEEGLARVLGERVVPAPEEPDTPDETDTPEPDRDPPVTDPTPIDEDDKDVQTLIKDANKAFEEAQERMQSGDWAGYGRKIEELKDILRRMERESS